MNLAETFISLQGEGSFSGTPCYFIRMAGCSTGCRWCDTPYARQTAQGAPSLIESIAFEIPDNIELVQITGGEPLEQRKGLLELIDLLSQNGKRVLLETSGQLPLAGIPDHVHISMDIKCPSSGVNRQMSSSRGALDRTVQENLGLMKETDEIKFVVADDKDFSYAREVIQENNLEQRVKTIFSPVFGKMDPSRLARLLLESGLRSSRMQLQLHKVIWGPNQRGV